MMFPVPLADALVGELVPNGTVFDQGMGASAFCEIGNILCGSYLTALAEFMHVQINQSPPVLAIDMEFAILGEGLIELSIDNDAVIMIDTVIIDRELRHEIKGEFIFLPVPESMDVIFHMAEGES
ncbi:chemotaxis protein CheC [Terrilactibacillus sp. S3-3]|nr:chemotaxis protein CheC [Terrilactibacillus sp. S3-3]